MVEKCLPVTESFESFLPPMNENESNFPNRQSMVQYQKQTTVAFFEPGA